MGCFVYHGASPIFVRIDEKSLVLSGNKRNYMTIATSCGDLQMQVKRRTLLDLQHRNASHI